MTRNRGTVKTTDSSRFNLIVIFTNAIMKEINRIIKGGTIMRLIGVGLCLIGIGMIGYDVVTAFNSSKIPRWLPKGRPAGTYESDMEWEFPEE